MFGLSSAINKVCDGFDEEASSGTWGVMRINPARNGLQA